MYIIEFVGILERGIVKVSGNPFAKSRTIRLGSMNQYNDFATKFRFKFMANFVCYILNKSDNCFRTYYIKNITY